MAYYQQNALSIASRSSLAKMIAEMVNTNEGIEESRERLAALPFFDALQLFRFLDRDQKGFLAERDFQYIVGTAHRKLLTYAFSWADCRKVGEISRFQFANFLLPRENLALRQANLRSLEESQMDKGQLDTLSVQVIEFQALLKQLMNCEMKLIELRHSLIKSHDYSLQGVRLALATSDRQWICAEDIHTFMQNYGFDITLRQAQALMQAIGKEQEGRISFEHLRWVVQGLEGKDKSYLDSIKQSNKKKPAKKPSISNERFKEYLAKKKKIQYQPEVAFSGLVQRMRLIEKEQRTNQKKLLSLQKKSRQSVKKQCEKQIKALQLKREQSLLARKREKQQQQIQLKLQQQLQEMMRRTARLQQDSERILRLQNRLNIIDDSATIKKQIQIYPRNNSNQKINRSFTKEAQANALSFRQSLERENWAERSAIHSHIKASEVYLQYSKQAHLNIMRERQQKALNLNKENEMRRQINIKTPGALLYKNKVSESIDSKFEAIDEIPAVTVNKKITKEQQTST